MKKVGIKLIEEDIFKCIIPLSLEAAMRATPEVTPEVTGEVAGHDTRQVPDKYPTSLSARSYDLAGGRESCFKIRPSTNLGLSGS